MGYLAAILLGVIQGITEFLPISSTAHLRIIPALLGWSDPGAAFTAIIQLGTLAAVLAYFRREIWELSKAVLLSLAHRKPFETQQSRLGWYVLIGTFPIGVCGLLFKKWIETSARSLYIVATSLVVLALLLSVAEWMAKHLKGMDGISLLDSQLVGVAQALALIPGVSRSGVTLTAALFLGMRRADAARFSFLLSIPAVAAAGLYELKHVLHAPLGGPGIGALVVATAAAFFSGYLAIAGLIRFLQTRSTAVFVVYRIALGLALFGLLAKGIIQA